MCAGKSDLLLRMFSLYRKFGINSILFTHYLDVRFARGHVMSRVGIRERSFVIDDSLVDIYEYVLYYIRFYLHTRFILVDEVQFLQVRHIAQMLSIVRVLGVSVYGFGLCTDFLGDFFLSSATMLDIADDNVSLSVECFCGRKAIMNMRINKKGRKVTTGARILVGGAGVYTQVCRYHYG